MNWTRLLMLIAAASLAGCATAPTESQSMGGMPNTTYQSIEELQVGAQGVLNAFASDVARARGSELGPPPTAVVRNTPLGIWIDPTKNQVIVPWYETQPPEMKAVFRRLSDGTDAGAERLFRVFFNGFLIAHEAGHWYQYKSGRREPTHYHNEEQANRLAVAFWKAQPGGENFLRTLESLATDAANGLTDPTPAGQDPVEFFGANYLTLARDPLKYGYYQFRFMSDAIRNRNQLDLATLLNRQATK